MTWDGLQGFPQTGFIEFAYSIEGFTGLRTGGLHDMNTHARAIAGGTKERFRGNALGGRREVAPP